MDRAVRDSGSYAFGPFRLDPARRELTRQGAPVALTPTVFDTLLYLVEHPGRVVSKDELLEAIWPQRVVEESNVTQTIFTLRRALNDGADGERLIITIPGRGYSFAAPVRLEAGLGPSGEIIAWPLAPDSTPAKRRGLLGRWRPWPILVGAALCALALAALTGVVGLWRAAPGPRSRGPVVVADFQNLTGDPIFDKTLSKAVAIDLDQSPFVTVLADPQVQGTLLLMTRSKDAPLTPDLAREVCARNNGSGVLDGSIVALGANYLLTLTASNCAGDKVLAAEKTEVRGREAVVAAVDGLVSQVRGRLGESTASVRRFDAPMLPERTASLEALKAFSEATWLGDHGQPREAIPLFQHAIELDPNFAVAYASLSALGWQLNEDDTHLVEDNIRKAYALRDTVGEREKFDITSLYNLSNTKDYYAAIRNVQVWSEIYPLDPAPWVILGWAQTKMARYRQAVDAGRRALALNPDQESAYFLLAWAYLHVGELGRARAICDLALARGLAGDETHELFLRLAFDQHDQAGVAREMAWARGKPAEAIMLAVGGLDALNDGRVRRAEALFARATELDKARGLGEIYGPDQIGTLIDYGLTDRARDLLKHLSTSYDPSSDYGWLMAEVGDATRAEAALARYLRKAPADTLANGDWGPLERAQIALRRGQPREAIAALEHALPIDRDLAYTRGLAYLELADGPHAAAEFQRLLADRGIDQILCIAPLARLGLARAYRLEGNLPASRREYQTFFAAWRNADPDVPILRAAKAEYARL
jgi:DNA-binding winged helix-turn-helix (wHTH) protein/tetratricopeptide (TPR) repeat protein